MIGLINSLTIHRTVMRTIVVIAILFVLTSCNEKKATVKDGAKLVTPTVRTDVKKGIQPEPDEQVAVIETADYGNIVIELYPNIAPQMVKRFKTLASEEFYNGTAIHRINAASGLIQGGDPLSKNDNPSDDGLGESSYPNVPGEFSDIPYDRGIVGAARRGASPEFAGRAAVSEEQARNTANCQFFITMKRAPQYDENYTVFGKVIEGLTNVEIVMRAPVEPNSERPGDKIVVKTVTLQPRSKYVK